MNVNFKLSMPRKTYDGLCRYLDHWGQIYGQANAAVLRGSLRKGVSKVKCGAVATDVDAKDLSRTYGSALGALRRAVVKTDVAVVDLRNLSEEESAALHFVYGTAKLLEQQYRALDRLYEESRIFRELPEMVRVAIAALD